MNSRLLFALFVAIFGLLTTQVAADLCLGLSLSTKTKTCGGRIPCEFGMSCDKTATCVPSKTAGQACESSSECQLGLSCNGPDKAKVCATISGPGQTCDPYANSTQPRCASGLSCDFTTSKCTGGRYQDGCTTGDDCASGVCTGGACAVPTNCTTSSSFVCEPTHYCDGDFLSGVCVAKKSAGAACDNSLQCADNGCLGKEGADPDVDNKVCVAKASLEGGAWIDNNNNKHLCKSGISRNDHCQTDSPVYCEDDDECTTGETCLCNKGWLLEGTGKCGKHKCSDVIFELNKCMTDNCPTQDIFALRYSNSCVSRNCRTAFDEAADCNPTFINMIFGA